MCGMHMHIPLVTIYSHAAALTLQGRLLSCDVAFDLESAQPQPGWLPQANISCLCKMHIGQQDGSAAAKPWRGQEQAARHPTVAWLRGALCVPTLHPVTFTYRTSHWEVRAWLTTYEARARSYRGYTVTVHG